MPKLLSQKGVAGLVLFFSVTTILFQNCGKNFEVMSQEDMLSQGLVGSEDPHIMLSSADSSTGKDVTFSLHLNESSSNSFISWSYTLNGANGGCTTRVSVDRYQFIVNCPTAGSLVVSANVWDNATQIAIAPYTAQITGTSTTTTNPPPTTTGNGGMVTFTIQPGTGTSPWNTLQNVVEVYVGQTLVVQNNDSIAHRMHTGGKPCPHGSDIPAGASGNCVISQAYNYGSDGFLYDHYAGSAARFYVIAYSGSALYTQSCSGCHNDMASSDVKGRSPAQITSAIKNVNQMANSPGLKGLTAKQIEAISFALGGVK